MLKPIVALIIFAVIIKIAGSQNPVIPDIGMSDPHVRIFDDTIFLYTGHDSHPDDKTWVMKNWRVFSSTDLVNWKLREVISPEDNYMDDNSEDCWAADAATRSGKYYFYFSDRKRGVGVMSSDKPTGPFEDALGKPLVSPMHDPTILIDDDDGKTPYLVYGDKEGGGFHIAQLNENMISLAENPKPIKIIGEEWEDAPQWMDKNYIFKHNKTYYLSWGRDYAISKNVYGPYKCMGAVGTGHHLSEFAHGSFFKWKGQFYHIWCYYIRPGYKYRESIITYCHMDDKGKIVTDTNFLDHHFSYGVGRYNADWTKIEAEWYYEISSGAEKRGTREQGFVVAGIANKSWLKYAKVNFGDTNYSFSAKLSGIKGEGKIEIRTGSVSGPVIGTAFITKKSKSANCKLQPITGEKDIFLVFSGNSTFNCSLDWLSFTEK